MVSARTAQLTDRLDVVRREMDLAMKQVPTDYARIACVSGRSAVSLKSSQQVSFEKEGQKLGLMSVQCILSTAAGLTRSQLFFILAHCNVATAPDLFIIIEHIQ